MLYRILLLAIPVAVIATIYYAPAVAAGVFEFVFFLSPLWLAPLLAYVAWPLWLTQVRLQYASRIRYRTYELKAGDNTPRTAKPFESVLYSLYHRAELDKVNTFLKGEVRLPFSFEITASGGIVKMYVHAAEALAPKIITQLLAEYPDLDIDEVDDYALDSARARQFPRLTMREYALALPDPYPLATYESYEHEKVRRNVFAELLEDLVRVSEHEEVWVSLMVRPHQRDWGKGAWEWREEPTDTLHEDAKAAIQSIVGKSGDIRGLPAAKRELVESIEHGLKKPSFDCGLRVVYRAKRLYFSKERVAWVEHLFDRFSAPERNSFETYDPRNNIGWPMADALALSPQLREQYYVMLYRARAFFAPPYYGTPFILSTEELATLFHIPRVAQGSALSRVSGMRLEPPDNLPR